MAHISGFERDQLLLLPETVDDYVGADARDAIECIKVISAAYLSASLSSREVTIVDARPPARENGARPNGQHRAAPSRP